LPSKRIIASARGKRDDNFYDSGWYACVCANTLGVAELAAMSAMQALAAIILSKRRILLSFMIFNFP
jgi:hypothetical protein